MQCRAIWLILGLAACDMGHLGNPILWPVTTVGNGSENARYGGRRKQVGRHIDAHYSEIMFEIKAGSGPALTTAADLARVPMQKRPELVQNLQRDIKKFTPNTPENRELLVVWLMVHGG